MNCKPGDLAVVVWSDCGHEGKFVRCIELVGFDIWVRPNGEEREVATWHIDRCLTNFRGEANSEIADDQLRPIRGSEGQDETLSWKPLPLSDIEPVRAVQAALSRMRSLSSQGE